MPWLLKKLFNKALGTGSYDPNAISSPVVKSTSLYAMLNLAATLPNMELVTMDVGTAFLTAKLSNDGTEDVYIALPPCCMVVDNKVVIRPEVISYGKRNKKVNVVRLLACLYGLKNSPAGFYRTVSNFLKDVGFTISEEDKCLFTRIDKNGATLMLVIHVDDMMICGVKSSIEVFTKEIEAHFEALGSKITHGNASDPEGVQFLGSVVKMTKDTNGTKVTMNQSKRIEGICERLKVDVEFAKPTLPYSPDKIAKWSDLSSMPQSNLDKTETMLQCRQRFGAEVANYEDVIRNYRSYTGNLIWLCGAGCPQVLPIVYKLARYQNNPGVLHFEAVRRVLQYLYIHRDRCLTFGKQQITSESNKEIMKSPLVIFTDTSHGDCPITKRSSGGYCVFLFGSLLLIRSYRLSCVTTSSTQSEYYMMSAAAAESLYLMDLYNNALLPFINGVLQSTHVRQAKMPVMTSGLSNELVATLNSKTFPMINEQNKMTLLGDNASALLMAYKGAMKNSRHSMIHASWLWELIHYRKVLTAESPLTPPPFHSPLPTTTADEESGR